jgi:hypothetical protein
MKVQPSSPLPPGASSTRFRGRSVRVVRPRSGAAILRKLPHLPRRQGARGPDLPKGREEGGRRIHRPQSPPLFPSGLYVKVTGGTIVGSIDLV